MSHFFLWLHTITPFFIRSVAGMPSGAWWVPALVLLLLAILAAEDARSGHIPDSIIAFGMILTIGTQGYYVSPLFAAAHVLPAIGVAFLLWSVNKSWYLWRRHDALGMGDVKWTMLAVTCFGITPNLFSWFLGAWLALVWMGGAHVIRYKINRVHFAPFLFLGLLVGIYWIRLKS